MRLRLRFFLLGFSGGARASISSLILEAMACATPVICSDAPSLTELVGDAALIVTRAEEPGADELAAALTRVLADSALHQELSQRGAARAARFTWVRTAQETLAVYEQAANS